MIPERGYCCCDIYPNYNDHCGPQASGLQGCEADCDTWLNVSVSLCIEPNPCWFSTAMYTDTNSVDNFDDRFIFVLSSFSDTVSVNKYTILVSQCLFHSDACVSIASDEVACVS